MSATLKTVLVTGGSGFLGSWCIQVLLSRGYYVRATVRNASKAEYLMALPGAATHLRLYPGVDLLTPGAFDEAVEGCQLVLHTASPFFNEGGSEEKLVVPAVNGTLNVLNSCRKFAVERVVLTASTASVWTNYGTMPEDHVYSDNDWSREDLMRQHHTWYALSKTIAERVAWEASREEGCPYQLVVINPTLILGPQLPGQPHLNTSQAAVVGCLDGSISLLENSCKSLVDVRDVALAHVNALEVPEAAGRRFLLISCCPSWFEIAGAVRRAVPEDMKANVPTRVNEALPATIMAQAPPFPSRQDVTPSQNILGINYRSLDEMVKDSVDSLLANGFHSKQMYSSDKL